MPSTTAWTDRPAMRAGTAERVAALVDSELRKVDGLLFTASPREDLDLIGRFQQAKDQAFAGQLRAIVDLLNRTPATHRRAVEDEVALALNVGPVAGTNLVALARQAAALPGLIEAVEHDVLTERHLRTVVDELGQVELELEQRHAVVLIALARYAGETPGELGRLVRRLVLAVDPEAARRRKETASRRAFVDTRHLVDGQGSLYAVGPEEQVAAMRAAIEAGLKALPADDRSTGEREFAVLVDLVTGGSAAGGWAAHVVVPFSTALGGDLELADLPGFGPVLPSTARDLLEDALSVTQVAVDAETGEVIGVGDERSVRPDPATASAPPSATAPAAATAARATGFQDGAPRPGRAAGVLDPSQVVDTSRVQAALRGFHVPPVLEIPDSPHYRPGTRLRRFVQARDQRCVFPGCGRPAAQSDLDHRVPWPRGATSAANLQCLCRRHHRAKQALFTVTVEPDGTTTWTTRGGWTFTRRRPGY